MLRRCLCNSSVALSAINSTVSANTSSSKALNSSPKKIIIPRRIKRGPTDILKALAGTVTEKDPTAPKYKLSDDPYLISEVSLDKCLNSLSKEHGKRAARWLALQWPELFMYDYDQPKLDSFRPFLETLSDAKENNAAIEKLALHCFGAVAEFNSEERFYLTTVMKRLSKAKFTTQQLLAYKAVKDDWSKDEAVKLFTAALEAAGTDSNAIRAAYAALICGLAKHRHEKDAESYFKEMKEKQLLPNRLIYNSLIKYVASADSRGNRWKLCEQYMKEMAKTGILPDVHTFNAVLHSISQNTESDVNDGKNALRILAEMRACGVSPSLSTMVYIQKSVNRYPSFHSVMLDILRFVEQKNHEENLYSSGLDEEEDCLFFVDCMRIIELRLKDAQLASRLHRLLMSGKNQLFLNDALKEFNYYRSYLSILLEFGEFEHFWQEFNKYVPNTVNPSFDMAVMIVQAIKANHKQAECLPVFYATCLIALYYFNKQVIVNSLIECLLAADKTTLAQQMRTIAEDLFRRIEEAEDRARTKGRRKTANFIEWTFDLLIKLCLILARGDAIKAAVRLIDEKIPDLAYQQQTNDDDDNTEIEDGSRGGNYRVDELEPYTLELIKLIANSGEYSETLERFLNLIEAKPQSKLHTFKTNWLKALNESRRQKVIEVVEEDLL